MNNFLIKLITILSPILKGPFGLKFLEGRGGEVIILGLGI
jgi:hypothetical protein